MKQLILFLILIGTETCIKAQTIPVFPVKKLPYNSPTKPTSTKSKAILDKETSKATIKFLCDADAILYIDGEKRGSLKKDIPLRISLAKGEYVVKAVGLDNSNDVVKLNYVVSETGMEKLVEIILQSIIKVRINHENAEVEKTKRIVDLEIDMVEVRGYSGGNFAIGKFEVTQAQWRTVMGNNPSVFKGDNMPVQSVSYNDVQNFIEKLNAATGKKYRLPYWDEWTFAASGGSLSQGYKYAGSDDLDEVAWYYDNSNYELRPVGRKKPNELGIYDMCGNIDEMLYPAIGNEVRLIGGSYRSGSKYVNFKLETDKESINERFNFMGFRLALKN